MTRFEGKVVVVTGSASGFGLAIAERFSDEGASVVLADIDEAGNQRLASELAAKGRAVTAVTTDVSKSSDVEAAINAAKSSFGGLDVIVNNAGFTHRLTPMTELTEEEFDRVFAVNTKSVYLSVVHGVPLLKERGGGVIVNTASIGAKAPRPLVTAYNATKGAVVTMTRGLAVELARDNIRVNAVNPVAADTNFFRGAYEGEALPERSREALVKTVPLRRLTEPADVAASVTFLASEDARFLTGVCLDVDGGRSIS